MDRTTILQLVAYDDWANDRVIEALAGLSEEELDRPLPGSFPSLRATWAHLVMAEWLWFERWQGRSPAALPEWTAGASLERLNEALLEVRRQRAEILAALGGEDLQRQATYTNLARSLTWRVEIGQMLTHVVTHSTYHRGQITTLLRQLGRNGVTTDFLVFAAR